MKGGTGPKPMFTSGEKSDFPSDLPIDEATILGDTSILRRELAVILNSRQSKTPVGNDLWVKETLAAVNYALDNKTAIVTSTGMNTWELSLWAVGKARGKAVIICPMHQTIAPSEVVESIARDFQLDPDCHAWVFVSATGKTRSGKAWWEARDRIAFGIANRIYPVSIRPNGRWDTWLDDLRPDQELIEDFRTRYNPRSTGSLPIECPENCFKTKLWPWLTHWTCRSYGPWPGEISSDFYRAMTLSGHSYSRCAKETLRRILDENLIRGSGKRIRGGTPVVSLTALAPANAMPLMKWRKRFVRPTFEPYGIAIAKDAAEKIGICPVTYTPSSESPPEAKPVLVQGYGTGDWPAESEWRAVGDIDLTKLPPDDLLVLVPSTEIADEFRKMTSIRCHPMCESFDPV